MMLQLKNISLSFTNSRKDTFKLLDKLNLSIEKGKITALVGGNGSGKTTLFNIISGLQNSYSGEIIFNGEKINYLPTHHIAQKGIGRLFQDKQLIGDLTLLENMKIASGNSAGEKPFAYLFNRKSIDKQEKDKEGKAIHILQHLFGEENKYMDMLHHKANCFSYGEQRIVGLARLLMNDYRLLLLDEPTSGINPVYIETIKQIILKMVQEEKLTILLIEHNMHFVREVANYCAYIDNGTIVQQGLTSTVLETQEVKNSYLGL